MKAKKRFRVHERFHLVIKGKRTTVSLEYWLVDVLCLKMGVHPRAAAAHALVRSWLQKKAKEDVNRYAMNRGLRTEVVFEIMDKKLSERYGDFLVEGGSR